jgi:Xaa-Pro aminopeptidase
MTKHSASFRQLLVDDCRVSNELPFPRSEFRARLKAIRTRMSERGIDLLFLSSPESLFYSCGYKAEWYQAQSPKDWLPAGGAALRADRDGLILFDTDDEELMCRCETCADDIRIWNDDMRVPMNSWVVHELRDEGWLSGTVGLEFWSYRPNRAASEMFQSLLENNGCKVVDGSDILREIRLVKSERELECIERAAEIADIGMKAASESIRPGMTELAVYGDIIRAMARAGGENPAITIPVISGDRSPRGHALASRKKIVRGEIVNVDLCGVFNRYHSNMARTFSVGKPHREVEDVVNKSAASFETLKELLVPNLMVTDLLRRMEAYYSEKGILKDKMWFGGYELGISFPPDWVGAFVYDSTLDLSGRRFLPGTVVNYESNFYLPEKAGGSLLINTIVFREKSAKMLGNTPNELIVL